MKLCTFLSVNCNFFYVIVDPLLSGNRAKEKSKKRKKKSCITMLLSFFDCVCSLANCLFICLNSCKNLLKQERINERSKGKKTGKRGEKSYFR